MQTNLIELNKAVNVTVHRNYLKSDKSSYARVKRKKVGINSVIAEILKHNNVLDKATLIHSAILFKDGILNVLKSGHAVDLFELGTLYLTANGNINSANPNISDIPQISLGFTPSLEACRSVKDVQIDCTIKEDNLTSITMIEDRYSFKTDDTITAGKSVSIYGKKLRISGEESEVGVFFAPQQTDGNIDITGSDWIHVKESQLGTNMPSCLNFFLPQELIAGNKYTLIIKTASSGGKRVNKNIRKMVYDNVITIV